jgi:predicted chitinase
MITAAQIKKIAPGAKQSIVDGIVSNQGLMSKHGINTPLRAQHFLAQCAQESAGFTRLEENLTYTTTKRLRQVWPSRFKSDAAAKPFVRNPEALAHKVYGGRKDLGNTEAGDGWKYRGSGLKQLTGRSNYEQFQKATGLPVVTKPDMIRKFPEALLSACVFWEKNNLNRFADADDIVGLTRAINGGETGLSDRRTYLNRARGAIQEPPGSATVKGLTASEKPTQVDLMAVQKRLLELGYTEVGGIDGKKGTKTEAAILAFRNDNGLPSSPDIDDTFLEALMKAPPRKIAPERAKATVGDLREKGSEIIAGSDVVKIGTAAAGVGTAAAPAADFLADTGQQVGDITEKLSPFQSLLQFFADYAWIAILIIVGVVGVYGIKIARARLRDHRTGNTSVVNLPKVEGQ